MKPIKKHSINNLNNIENEQDDQNQFYAPYVGEYCALIK